MRELRLSRGLTQEQLADQIGVTFSAVGKLERGETRLRIDQAKKFARVLGVHELELLLELAPDEIETLDLLRAADPELRRRALDVMRTLLAPLERARPEEDDLNT